MFRSTPCPSRISRALRWAWCVVALGGCALGAGAQPATPPALDAPEDRQTLEARRALEVRITRAFYDGFPLPLTDGAVPPRGRRNLEIRYRVEGAAPADSLHYSFRMEGTEVDWANVGSRTIAYYRDMQPGAYTFQVRAAHPDGDWGEAAELPVVIEGYLYEERWFRGLALLILAGLMWAAFRWQIAQARTRAETLERLVDERTRALQTETDRTQEALAQAERERQAAQEALATVEEQSLQLLRMDHAKSRLFANLSHEFRTPLTLILDPLERAVAGAFGPLSDDGLRTLGGAHQNAHRLLHLINQLLDLAKFEAGAMDIRTWETDLVPLLRQATETFSSEALRQEIDLRFHTDAPEILAYVDREKMEKVVHNLVSNALKATQAGGKVVLSVSHTDDGAGAFAEITVRDTGDGISDEELPHVFDRFYQAETGRLKGGTGIGLALAREVVDLHHGHIDVESVHGFGSTFTVRLPLGRAHLAAHEVLDAPPPPLPGLPAPAPPSPALDAPSDAAPEPAEAAHDDRPLVLVVEDHPEIRQLVVGHLRPHYRVLEAGDGVPALRLARERRPALIVSDVLMPEMDGLALCRRVKADERLGDTPMILLTARASDADRLEALETGADAFLTKPFSGAELLVRAGNLIRSRAAIRQRYSEEVVLPTTGQAVPSADAAFLERVYTVVGAHLDDEAFTVGALAAEVGLSESSLKRRLRSLLETTPVEFVRARRLERAAALLLGRAGTVGEIAAQVGFGSLSYFAKCFRERYGAPPSAYADVADPVPEPLDGRGSGDGAPALASEAEPG